MVGSDRSPLEMDTPRRLPPVTKKRISKLRPPRIRSLSTLTMVVLATTVALSPANSAAAETPPAPPFYQCPAIGQDTDCGLVILVNPDGTTTVLGDPNQTPSD